MHSTDTERRRQFFKSFEAKSLKSRSILTQISDDLTSICGSMPFLLLHLIYVSAWILINLGHLPEMTPFDPFPFGLLTMLLSIEAIFLSIFILVSQNRSSYVNTMREEVHLRVNLIAEEEITKVLEVLAEIRAEMGIKKVDPELEKMLERINTTSIEQSIINQVSKANVSLAKKLEKDFPELLMYPVKKPFELVQNMAANEEAELKAKLG